MWCFIIWFAITAYLFVWRVTEQQALKVCSDRAWGDAVRWRFSWKTLMGTNSREFSLGRCELRRVCMFWISLESNEKFVLILLLLFEQKKRGWRKITEKNLVFEFSKRPNTRRYISTTQPTVQLISRVVQYTSKWILISEFSKWANYTGAMELLTGD